MHVGCYASHLHRNVAVFGGVYSALAYLISIKPQTIHFMRICGTIP